LPYLKTEVIGLQVAVMATMLYSAELQALITVLTNKVRNHTPKRSTKTDVNEML